MFSGEETAWSSQTTDHDVDDFLPEVNESNLFVLQKAGEEAVITTPVTATESHTSSHSEDADSLPADLMIPEGSLPDVEVEDEEESDICDDDVEDPGREVVGVQSDGFTFKTGHFNRDTSSSDEDSMARGLNFQDYSLVDAPEEASIKYKMGAEAVSKGAASSSLPFGINEAWNVVGSFLKASNPTTSSHTEPITRKASHPPAKVIQKSPDSSDESEFEILSQDELNSAS